MAKMEIRFKVLEDGTTSFVTGKIPQEQHAIADELQKEFHEKQGGEVQRLNKAAKPRHTHNHDHVHELEH